MRTLSLCVTPGISEGRPRSVAWRRYCPLTFQKRATGAELPFDKSITGNFNGLSRSTLKQFIAAIRSHRKFRMVFHNSCC